nr:2'-5' RNA ligase family protein [uncultured Hyphomonas sp.]
MSRALFTLALPEFAPGAREWVNHVRAAHDREFAGRVDPHFTLVFGNTSLDQDAYLAHVREVAGASAPFPFSCRKAEVGTDHQNDTGYAFLVPDVGHSEILGLRTALHTGIFAPLLRPDIPYRPHITAGRFDRVDAARPVCDTLNASGIDVSGRITALTVVAMQADGRIDEVASAPLGGRMV